jgi:hypothetical protein
VPKVLYFFYFGNSPFYDGNDKGVSNVSGSSSNGVPIHPEFIGGGPSLSREEAIRHILSRDE